MPLSLSLSLSLYIYICIYILCRARVRRCGQYLYFCIFSPYFTSTDTDAQGAGILMPIALLVHKYKYCLAFTVQKYKF